MTKKKSAALKAVTESSEDSFQDWTDSKKKSAGVWQDWPQEVHNEIRAALKLNDSGSHKITVRDMLERMADVHDVKTSKETLNRYCKIILKRSSWSNR